MSTTTCALCASSTSALVQLGVRYAPGAEVRRCGGCGFVYLTPRPSQAELDEYYRESYGLEYDYPTIAERHSAGEADAAARVDRLAEYLTPSTRLLEVGAGSGAFLAAVAGRVETATAVEPDPESREWLESQLGLTVHASFSDAMADRPYDVIVLFHVLEHVLDPVAFLKDVAGPVRSGGIVTAEVPNVDDALITLYESSAFRAFYYQQAHLSYFDPGTLARTFEAAGLSASVSGVQRYDLSNHLRWLMTGKPGGNGYYRDVLAQEVDEAYARSLAHAGRTDTLWAVARVN